MTRTDLSELSGAFGIEWRGTPPHSTERAPLDGRSGRLDRAGLLGLLVGTAVLYLWGLGSSGYANEFYAAAVQAGTKSWKAFLFGSLDSSNFITVDKPPAALWPMELSGRLFGFDSWSLLVPQAIEGVLAVWLLYATVRRWFGPRAGLLAGALLALTPVAVLMFRFDNPDSLMTLLMVVAAYCVTRAIERAGTRWLLLAGVTMGFAFLAKGLQPFTVLPALAAGYLVAAPTGLRRRLLQLLAAAGALVAGAGWWLLVVALWPASSRPYIGGSGDNTPLGLAFGYNGLSRLTGGPGGGTGFSGSPGLGRLFNSLDGGQIAWLLPAALIGLVALAVVSRTAPRTDRTRAAAIVWGGWLLVTGGVLSLAGGIIHTYYTVELAPAVAALVAIGALTLWRRRDTLAARLTLAAAVAATGAEAYVLLHRTPAWHPWVGELVLVATVLGTLPLVARTARASLLAIPVALLALIAGPAAYAVQTAATPHGGGTPSAGPSATAGPGGFGPGRPGPGSGFGPGRPGPGGGAPRGAGQFGGAGAPGAFPGGAEGRPTPDGGRIPIGGRAGTPAGNRATTNSALVSLLKASSARWAAATVGSQTAAPLELASGRAVMAIGGFNGTDPAPTLTQFEQLVAKGEIGYYIGDASGFGGAGTGPGPHGTGTGTAIGAWVAAHFTARTVGGTTVYDLSRPTSG